MIPNPQIYKAGKILNMIKEQNKTINHDNSIWYQEYLIIYWEA